MPDHGKLMHLFLVREPGLDVFAHLHPIKRGGRYRFETLLPNIPEGSYRLYADVTFETGSADTSTTVLQVPAPPSTAETTKAAEIRDRVPASDPDDSWRVMPSAKLEEAGRCKLSDEYEMSWSTPPKLAVNHQITLRFNIRDKKGRSPELEPYLGMRGHMVLRSEDGSVFIHIHPGGTASMAAMQLSVLRAEAALPLEAAFGRDDPICKLPLPGKAEQSWLGGFGADSDVSFPYAFPRAGRYRMWVQVKVQGQILTGIFDAQVGG
jgi:hypothetical protein